MEEVTISLLLTFASLPDLLIGPSKAINAFGALTSLLEILEVLELLYSLIEVTAMGVDSLFQVDLLQIREDFFELRDCVVRRSRLHPRAARGWLAAFKAAVIEGQSLQVECDVLVLQTAGIEAGLLGKLSKCCPRRGIVIAKIPDNGNDDSFI